jgi:hypothetical protein
MIDTLSPLEPRKTVDVLKEEWVTEENSLASSSTFDMVDKSRIFDDGMVNPPPEQMEEVGEEAGANEEQQSILNYIGASPLAQDDEEVRSATRLDSLRKKEADGRNFLLQKLGSVRNLNSPNREKTRKSCLGRVSVDLASKYGPDARQRSSVPASSAGMDRRSLLTKRKSSCGLKKIILSPDDTPPRRLVLKMIDLQEALTALNGKVMSGLAVKPEAWDSITELITRLERNFREDIIFSWRKPILPERTDEEGNQTSSESDTADNDVGGGTSEMAIAPPRRTKRIKSLARLEKEFKKVVDVRDRKYQMITYSDVFVGTDAVDAIVYAGLAGTREEAVELGRALARERRLFKHVTNEHRFEDKHYFYHYNDRDDDSLSSLEEEDGVSASMFLSDVLESGGSASEMKAFKDAVGIRDRKYRMKLYPKVFVGSGTFLFELFLSWVDGYRLTMFDFDVRRGC